MTIHDYPIRIGEPIDGRTFVERTGSGRMDWWYVAVTRPSFITEYTSFPTKAEAVEAVRKAREAEEGEAA